MEDNKETAAAPAHPETTELIKTTTTKEDGTTTEPAKETMATESQQSSTVETIKASPVQQLFKASQEHQHGEIWGVTLADPEKHIASQIVFQKYLNANDGNITAAKDQLMKTLTWRAEKQPLDLVKKQFPKDKFEGLGYVTRYTSESSSGPESQDIFTWNIYGIVKDFEKTFGDLQE
jgi:phosphatidylinositol transfer protein SFH5